MKTKPYRVTEIDLLRFTAAIAVVFFHYAFRGFAANDMTTMPYPHLAPFAKYGYLGVELFFMISGFVIIMSTRSGLLKDFIISRFSRLYPAFWACCTITFLTTLIIGEHRYSASTSQYLANMTMFSGFLGIPSIDGAYWSLFVEMRFYALVGVVLVIGKIQRIESLLAIWLITTIASELLPTGKLIRYMLISDYSTYFIAGSTFFLIHSKGLNYSRLAIIILSWCLALLQSIKGIPLFETHYNTTMNEYAICAIITTFYVFMLCISLRLSGFLGRTNWLTLGAITYPLYLLHQNIGYMIFNKLHLHINEHVIFWGTILFMIAFAYSIHVFFEKKTSSSIKNHLANISIKLSPTSSPKEQKATKQS